MRECCGGGTMSQPPHVKTDQSLCFQCPRGCEGRAFELTLPSRLMRTTKNVGRVLRSQFTLGAKIQCLFHQRQNEEEVH